MREGDLVVYHWPSFLGQLDNTVHDKGIGIVTNVEQWVDRGAPDRNFGVTVEVLWSDGEHSSYEEDELSLV